MSITDLDAQIAALVRFKNEVGPLLPCLRAMAKDTGFADRVAGLAADVAALSSRVAALEAAQQNPTIRPGPA